MSARSDPQTVVDARLETEDVGRDLGIPAMGLAPWGTHVCQFYADKPDLLDTFVPFFRAGLEANEKCFWATCEPLGVDEAAEALSHEVEDLERRLAVGQMVIVPYQVGYQTDAFDWISCVESVLPRVERAQAEGYPGIRCAADVGWLDEHQWDPFMCYEQAVNPVLAVKRAIGLCGYSLVQCGGMRFVDVLLRHQYALVKRQDWVLIEPSERKRATVAVEQMNQALAERTTELQAALAELRGFSRWVTHDLRAPLRHITSFSDLLAQEWESRLDDDGRRTLGAIRAGAARMDTLITDILAYSSAQQKALRIRPLDLEGLVRDAWATLSGTVKGRHVELQIRPLPPAYGDRAMVEQVLANLLGNAVKFTARKAEAHVEVGAREVDGTCAYYVRDDGIGFDMAKADKVFGAFERLHGRAEFEGSGLGLTIVKQIVTRHGGRVWVEASPGVGSTVYFTLPEPSQRRP